MAGRIGTWMLALGAVAISSAACSGRTDRNGQQPGAGASGAPPSSAGKTPVDVASGGSSATGGKPNGGSAGSDIEVVGGASAAGVDSGGSIDVGGAAAGGEEPFDPNAILKVKPSPGCGTNPTQDTGVFVKYTLQTSGVKEPNCADKLQDGTPKCGAWSLARDYYVWLPPDYQNTTPYELVLEGPGCGGAGTAVQSLSPTNDDMGVGANGTVIRVGLTPAPNSIGHGTNPGEGCFDDKEGDDSVDFVFYESLLDKLKTELCYDENRVFAAGASSGAWLANELGCKYAGDTHGHALRGVITDGGGFPNQPQYAPTCSNAPRAGFWIWSSGINLPIAGVKFAMASAMKVNGCTASDYDDAAAKGMVQNFSVGGGVPDPTCQLILGCSSQYPLVACRIESDDEGSHDAYFNPGAATFLKTLAAP